MRLKLTLRPARMPVIIPINYSHLLAAAIYKILGQASEPFASFLHEQGYAALSGRLLKMFTFSKLLNSFARPRKTDNLVQLFSPKDDWTLYVGSPMTDDFVQNFVLGLFEATEFAIGAHGLRATFKVEQVEALAPPDFAQSMRFSTLSPISVSTMIEKDGKMSPRYLLPEDADLSVALKNNLVQKHQIIYGRVPADDTFTLTFEKHDRPKTKLITLKEGRPDETKRRGFESHFTLTGSPELLQTAWECGLGEAGSMGFGMLEVENSEKSKVKIG